jgi:hypothetical protein
LEQRQEEDEVVITKSVSRRPHSRFSAKHTPSSLIHAESNLEVNEVQVVDINPISEVNTFDTSCFEPKF